MRYGAHLPLIDFGGAPRTAGELRAYTERAAALGFEFLCANDHLLFARPWLDGPSALAATVDVSADMTLATTVVLPVLRGPIQAAKTLAALDNLSDGRLVAGVGPGSSSRDYAAAAIPFDERWQRFDESIRALRVLLRPDAGTHDGHFYPTEGVVLEPPPVQRDGPPIWVASWGSHAGLRRVARLGDGWLASGYNTTPERFRAGADFLAGELPAAGKTPESFPNGIATMWLHVTDSRREADRILTDVLGPMLGRAPEAMRDLVLPVGAPELCAERLEAYSTAGARAVFLWPVTEELHQLTRFREDVVPLLSGTSMPAA
jgi:alkanesulfonate monooxygenase SsuD/methylene tetrahydromethanopterin reductase-like flavin-dependent oxidoreductase (luciferase family)